MAAQSLSVKESLSFGWMAFKREWKVILGYFGIMFGINVLFSAVSNAFVDVSGVVVFVVNLLSWLVQLVFQMAGVVLALDIVDGKAVGMGSIKEALVRVKEPRLVLTFVGGSLLYSLIVLGGVLLLVVPGLIWAMMYQYYRYGVVEGGMGVREALRHSREITRGKLGFLFVFALALVGINLLGLLALVVGLLVTTGVSFVASAYVYRQLAGEISGIGQTASSGRLNTTPISSDQPQPASM